MWYGTSSRPNLRGWSVPIRPLLAAGAFSPEDVATLTAAFEDILRALKLVDRSDPAVTLVAKRDHRPGDGRRTRPDIVAGSGIAIVQE